MTARLPIPYIAFIDGITMGGVSIVSLTPPHILPHHTTPHPTPHPHHTTPHSSPHVLIPAHHSIEILQTKVFFVQLRGGGEGGGKREGGGGGGEYGPPIWQKEVVLNKLHIYYGKLELLRPAK